MTTTPLTRELISDTSLWRLAMELRPASIEVVVFSSLEDNSLIYRSIPLDTTQSWVKALENAVYDNPLLLGEFARVDILVDTPRYTMVPNDLLAQGDDTGRGRPSHQSGDDTQPSAHSREVAEEVMQVLWPEDQWREANRQNAYSRGVYEVLEQPVSTSGETLLCGVETDVVAFVRRTFPEGRIWHRLTPMLKYFYNKGRMVNGRCAYVQLLADRTDVICLKEGRIAMVNTFARRTTDDTLYYLMTVLQALDFDVQTDRVMLCGSAELRSELMPVLRNYVVHVMPVLLPSTLAHTGPEASMAPFELIVVPICE